MKAFKFYEKLIKASAVLGLVFLTACGGAAKGVTTNTGSESGAENGEETENGGSASAKGDSEEYSKAEDEFTGESGVGLSLPGGQWDITLDNELCTRLEQGDKTITVSIMDDEDFYTSNLSQSAEDAASRFSSTDSPADVLDFSFESYEDGTALLSYTVKYKSSGNIMTLTTSTRVLGEHKAVVVDGIICQDADDAEIEMMKNAVGAAMIDKINDIEE